MKNNFKKTCPQISREISWLLKEKYFGKQTKQFFIDVKRLEAGEPVDYVIGFTNFLNCKIDLSGKPLIPRIETAFWVEKVINDIPTLPRMLECQNLGKKLKILDMFSGSGCIGLAIMKGLLCDNINNFEITFADNDKNAILQIKKNIRINTRHIRTNMGYTNKNKCVVTKSDIFESFEKPYFAKRFAGARFDFILANPPYIPTKNKSKVGAFVLKYEPKQALFGGGDGLFYIRRFLKQAKNHLVLPSSAVSFPRKRESRATGQQSSGLIFMEFDPPQKKAIEKLLKKFGYKSWQFHKDQFAKWRWVEIQ